MSSVRWTVARGLANALLAGEWERAAMRARAAEALGVDGAWLPRLIRAVLTAFAAPPHDARDALARFITADGHFEGAWSRRRIPRALRHPLVVPAQMREPRWPVKRLDTLGDVAEWLALPHSRLDWLADRKGLERSTAEPRLQNYRYAWVPKSSGGVRLLEAPKSELKALQRRVLHEILDAIPPHPAAHGFRAGRSSLTHAQLHAGNQTVIRFDLRSYFGDVPPARAFAVLRSAGYPEEVARTLIALCTNQVPLSVLQAAPRPSRAWELEALFHLRHQLAAPHLPQGAPTSPALANLCSRGLDVRLLGLARRLGATYSRYADDLTFSGGAQLAEGARRLERFVAEIVQDEGFSLNPRKTRVMRASERQAVGGIVVNTGVNVPRNDYDTLKATLHNCLRHGPASQARGQQRFEAHLLGRIAWVEQLNPARGAKLRRLHERIAWST